MAGRKYSNDYLPVKVVSRKAGKRNTANEARIAKNNRLARAAERNESVGLAEYSPLSLMGKGVNRAASYFLGDTPDGRAVRAGIKAHRIKKSRK